MSRLDHDRDGWQVEGELRVKEREAKGERREA